MVHERKHKDVARGRVYRIYDLREPSVALYVGSTVGPVNFRFCNHMMHIRCKKSRIKNKMYMYILQEGPDNFHWELLQQLDKTTRTTLRIAEQGHMDRLKPKNSAHTGRTNSERDNCGSLPLEEKRAHAVRWLLTGSMRGTREPKNTKGTSHFN